MKLPNAQQAHVDGTKVRDYLASPSHRHGRRKARAFAESLFNADTCDELACELLRIGREGEVTERVLTIYGTKYVVDARVRGPGGTVRLRTVWLLERQAHAPRLLTACILEGTVDEGTVDEGA